MSHFVVMVTHTLEEPVDVQLERFNEQGEPDDYFMEKEYIVERNWDSVKAYVNKELEWYEARLKDKGQKNKEYLEKVVTELKDILESDNLDFAMGQIHDHEGGIENEGGVYRIYNPNAKWDWYSIGGRWNGWLVDKKGNRCNICKVKDISFENMLKTDLEDSAKYYDDEIGRAKEEDREPLFFDFDHTPTKEEYLEKKKKEASVAPFAILHDDEWIEQGEMGWWGIVKDEKDSDDWEAQFKKWFESLDPETEITVVDCHI